MSMLTAYCFALRKRSEIINPVVVTLKNGRKAVRGRAKDAPEHTVFRLVSDAQARELEGRLEPG
jgi:hypothetical protein